jgi:hypothetical protein
MNDFDGVVMCYTPRLPKNKKYNEPQFSSVKTRNGRVTTPFLGLPSGEHWVKFYNDKESMTVLVKTWYSCYGHAWCIP